MSLPQHLEDLIAHFQLEAHPEGGFFREVYRAPGNIQPASLPAGILEERSYATSIFFLLPQGHKSHLHRLQSDEIWYFHLGGPVRIVEIRQDGAVETTVLGADWQKGQKLQHVVEAGTWFGVLPEPESPFTLVGCAVAPGFDFRDFEMGRRKELLRDFPQAASWISVLTPEETRSEE